MTHNSGHMGGFTAVGGGDQTVAASHSASAGGHGNIDPITGQEADPNNNIKSTNAALVAKLEGELAQAQNNPRMAHLVQDARTAIQNASAPVADMSVTAALASSVQKVYDAEVKETETGVRAAFTGATEEVTDDSIVLASAAGGKFANLKGMNGLNLHGAKHMVSGGETATGLPHSDPIAVPAAYEKAQAVQAERGAEFALTRKLSDA